MVTVNKANWWDELADFFSFSNSGSSQIDTEDMFSDLEDYVENNFSQMLSSSFQSEIGEVLKPSSSSQYKSNHLIATEPTDMIIGYGGYDYLAGTDQDNILFGGDGHDFFTPGGGIDFVIGNDRASAAVERDTVGYLTAQSGIVVETTGTASSGGGGGGSGLNPNQDVYTPTYEDWLAREVLYVSNFEVGPGGDFIDLSDALASINYTGNDPIGDGHVRFSNLSSGMKIQFDDDGFGGSGAKEMVRLLGISVEDFSIADNFSWDGSLSGGGSGSGSASEFFTFVSDDGDGDYDILYSIENIFGSDHNDVIHGHAVLDNSLFGGLGNDQLFGEGGNDILTGGSGQDTIRGGEGNDLLIAGIGGDDLYGDEGSDTFKFDASMAASIASNTSEIHDFETGSSGDKVDISEILDAIGYAGSDPLNDNYVEIVQSGDDTLIRVDRDGSGGTYNYETVVRLNDVDASNFSEEHNLITEADTTIFISVLGQSNAEGLRVFDGDNDSGITRMIDMVDNQTDYNLVTSTFEDENGNIVMPAKGGTRVDGNSDFDADRVWWFPDEGLPGEILVRAVQMLGVQIADLRASGAVKPVVVWGQGESDAILIGEHSDPQDRADAQDRYMDATLAVFDYIKDHLGDDIEFYIMQTGRYHEQAAQLDGVSQDVIDDTVLGLTHIRDAQNEMALTRSDVHLAANYEDLPMWADVDPGGHGTDTWHFHGDEREIIGDRIGDFIALEMGYDHILDNPGTYPLQVLSALDLKEHSGMTINGNDNDNIVVGTKGDDILTGGEGDDALYGGQGFDQVIYLNNFGDYTLQDNTWITVTDNVSDDGEDTLIDIEKIVFADGYYQGGAFFSSGGGNNDPIARDDVFAGDQDVQILGNLMANNGNGVDFDPDSDPLDVIAGTFTALHGSVQISANGDFVYTPDTGYVGEDSFTYTLRDDQGGQDIGQVDLTLNSTSTNNAPVARDDEFTGDQDVQILGNVLADNGNGVDFDPDSDPLNIVGGSFDTDHGTVELFSNGNFIYTPDAGYVGMDDFDYTLQDGQGGEDTGSVSLTLESTSSGDIIGTSGDDTLNGTVNNDTIYGLAGNDKIYGNEGDDILHGGDGNDVIKGREGDDIFYGGDGDDYLEGNAGNDILYGGLGSDTIKGSAGVDIFAYNSMDEAGDLIRDYRANQGEAIDISNILVGFNPLTDLITEFVEITDNGSDSFFKVDYDGGGDNFVLLATLQGVTGLTDEQDLFDNGNIIA